jgi:bifunctional DNase/RNase
LIQVTVERVGLDNESDHAVLLLADLPKSTILPIWVRTHEASVIAFPLQDLTPPRPVTADLLVSCVEKLNASVVMTILTELKDEVFYASLVLEQGGKQIELDCRPSDAIAVALRASAPIYVADSVMVEAGIPARDTEVQ